MICDYFRLWTGKHYSAAGADSSLWDRQHRSASVQRSMVSVHFLTPHMQMISAHAADDDHAIVQSGSAHSSVPLS